MQVQTAKKRKKKMIAPQVQEEQVREEPLTFLNVKKALSDEWIELIRRQFTIYNVSDLNNCIKQLISQMAQDAEFDFENTPGWPSLDTPLSDKAIELFNKVLRLKQMFLTQIPARLK